MLILIFYSVVKCTFDSLKKLSIYLLIINVIFYNIYLLCFISKVVNYLIMLQCARNNFNYSQFFVQELLVEVL